VRETDDKKHATNVECFADHKDERKEARIWLGIWGSAKLYNGLLNSTSYRFNLIEEAQSAYTIGPYIEGLGSATISAAGSKLSPGTWNGRSYTWGWSYSGSPSNTTLQYKYQILFESFVDATSTTQYHNVLVLWRKV
jgi:hypothetical protein